MAVQQDRPKKTRLTDWKLEEIGPTARVYSKPVDKSILKEMPVYTRTFLDVGVLDMIGMRLKSIFVPSSRTDRS